MPRMGEGKETSLSTARRLYRREVQKLSQVREDLRRREASGRTDGRHELCVWFLHDVARMAEGHIAGTPPAGVTTEVWRRVCRDGATLAYIDGEGI